MHIKKYRATSLKEATQIMKDELGAEALILGTRVVPDEIDKRLKQYEITAGYDKFEVAEETKEKVAKQNLAKDISFADEMKKMTERVYQQGKAPKEKVKEVYGLAPKASSETEKTKTVPVVDNRMKEIIKNLTI